MKEADDDVQAKEGVEWLYFIQTESGHSESSLGAGPEKNFLQQDSLSKGFGGWRLCLSELVSRWTLSLSHSDLLEC